MPKKQWTPEERKAFGDKMRAKRAEKLAEPSQPPVAEPTAPAMNNEDIQSLLRRIEELESQRFLQQVPQAQTPQFNHAGRLVGTVERYIVDPKHYPDPCVRLADEKRLQRFAFKDNYELGFSVSTTSYQTQDGINTREPKFTLELNRIVFDEDTGEPTVGRYTICNAIFHEDPQAAIVVARDNGVEVDETNEKAFLDEMRYLRMRDWLLEAFYPPKPSQPKKNKRDMVIGGKMVQYFEINSETSETIPFNELKTKV